LSGHFRLPDALNGTSSTPLGDIRSPSGDPALLQGSNLRQYNPTLHFSCNALELGTAKFGHPVENTDANLCFSLLIVEMSGFEFSPDHSLPSAHLGPTRLR
jgi:hypothetical protein